MIGRIRVSASPIVKQIAETRAIVSRNSSRTRHARSTGTVLVDTNPRPRSINVPLINVRVAAITAA
eukprot:9762308-Prorocentrum_lima.AAC.1